MWTPGLRHKYNDAEVRDNRGRWSGSAGTDDPPSVAWVSPPINRPRTGNVAGGFSATGQTNTQIGDLAEATVQKFGLQSLLPEGRRQNPLDAKLGKYGFEIKALTTRSSEYKIKMKAAEVASKVKYAKANGLKPAMMMVVMDMSKKQAFVYWRKGIGNYRLTNNGEWNHMGIVSIK